MNSTDRECNKHVGRIGTSVLNLWNSVKYGIFILSTVFFIITIIILFSLQRLCFLKISFNLNTSYFVMTLFDNLLRTITVQKFDFEYLLRTAS